MTKFDDVYLCSASGLFRVCTPQVVRYASAVLKPYHGCLLLWQQFMQCLIRLMEMVDKYISRNLPSACMAVDNMNPAISYLTYCRYNHAAAV